MSFNKYFLVPVLSFFLSLSCKEDLINKTISSEQKEEMSIGVDSIKRNFKKIKVAKTPPMGWNSFDAYDCRINEEEFKKTVDFMEKNLLKYGWEYAVIDYIWWHPEPGNWDTPRRKGHPNIRYNEDGSPLHPEYTTMDEFGRLMPSVKRFPSAKDGKGFKPLADYVHSKGLKFGIHIMRGIHRVAAFNKTSIANTNITADQIAEDYDSCSWCNHMWGVDFSKPGAQEYYNSLFDLYASWEVDFVKADDMMYPPYHKEEIEMIRKAIDQCGRPMVLSLSCGEAPLSRAEHLVKNANMWRVSGDFWDNWKSLEHNFDLLNAWSPFIGEGHWPDGDMLPIGHISLDDRPHGPARISKFTLPEQYTLMTLWSIAKSPLMMGGDLLSSDEKTISLLQNEEILYVNQHSIDNRQVFKKKEEKAIWIAHDPENDDKFLAIFNLSNEDKEISFSLERESLRGKYKMRDLWERKDLGAIKNEIRVHIPSHGTKMYRLSELR